MNVLITAGGTSEKIDDVRSITNQSTGKLGNDIALAFLKNKKNNVYYVCSKNAVKPNHASCHIIEIDSVSDLLEAITMLLTKNKMDAVIHSMAVSDYQLAGAIPEMDMVESLANNIVTTLENTNPNEITNNTFWESTIKKNFTSEKLIGPATKKISSDYNSLYLKLVKAPKVIHEIKKLQPNTILVGFKLLVETSKDNLLSVAKKLLKKNNCDFVLANDLSQIDQNRHLGYLLSADGSISKGQTKKEIADLIKEKVTAHFDATHNNS